MMDEDEDKEEGVAAEEEEQVDTSPWAGQDRDYSYEEVSGGGQGGRGHCPLPHLCGGFGNLPEEVYVSVPLQEAIFWCLTVR